MVLFVCKCLNVTLESDKYEDFLDVEKLELTSMEQRDIFFTEKLLCCPTTSLKKQIVQPALIGERLVGRWILHSCLACGQTTHATLQDRNAPVNLLIAKSIQTTPERITILKKSPNFSPVFNLLVPEGTNDIDMKENVDTNNFLTREKRGWPQTQHVIGSLNKQLNQTLQSQLEAVEEMVRQFRDQKYAEFEAYKERAQRDHKILASMISKAKNNDDNNTWKVDTSLDNGPPSPQLPPLQRRRLSSIKDVKKSHSIIKPMRNHPGDEDSLEAEELFFDLEDTDSRNMVSDQDDYDSDQGSNDEGIQVNRPRGGGAEIARSLPMTIAKFPNDRPTERYYEDDQLCEARQNDSIVIEHPQIASRLGTDSKPRTAIVVDEDDELYSGFNEVAPALDTRNLREDETFQETLRTAGIGRKMPSRIGTGIMRLGTVGMREGSSRAGTAARPVTALRAAGFTSAPRDLPSKDEHKEDSIEDKVKQMEARIMTLVEESCMLSARLDPEDDTAPKKETDLTQALTKAQEASALERQLIRMQEQANLGDTHNLDLTFAVLCNLADQYALNEMYTEALNTYQLLTRNKLFPHANRLKVNMGNIYFKMGEHPKALKLYRMALDQTPTAEKDLRMKVMHNIGLLLVRMGKFRDAVTNFQHIMHEQGDFQTGLHLVLCSVALNDAEGGKGAFHAMLDVEPPTYHQDIAIDDENDAYECVVRDVVRGDRLSRWSRRAAADAERCLALAAAALTNPTARDDESGGMSWCVEALRGYSGGAAGARLELGGALAGLRALRAPAAAAGQKALQRLKAVARAHPDDRVLRAEANADAAFVAYALGNWSEARALAESASRDDPYSCAARVCAALAGARAPPTGSTPLPTAVAWRDAAAQLAAATHLDPADPIAMHDLALALELSGDEGNMEAAEARWRVVRGAACAGTTLRNMAAAALARRAHHPSDADHWYSLIGSWDAGVTTALAELHSEMGDTHTAKNHYQDVEAVWPCELTALEWLARESPPAEALQYYRRAARLQPNNPQWGLLIGGCLRASGRYQEALNLYKKMNARFPDNIQCLKLIVKLCGDQGLSETSAWSKELQRAQARLKQQERVAVTSAGSGSSRTSQSPIDLIRADVLVPSRDDVVALRPAATATLIPIDSRGGSAQAKSFGNTESTQESTQPPIGFSNRSRSKKKSIEEFNDDLPLPPE